MKLHLPRPLPLGWKMKTVNTAQTRFEIDDAGVYHLHIDHDAIKNVTPQMLEWWFRNIQGEMEIDGVKYSRYRAWHPMDHIHWEFVGGKNTSGGARVGSRFRIVEAFQRDERHRIDSVEEVVKLDISGIRLVRRLLGVEIFSLEHQFHPLGEHHTFYRSHMTVGSRHWLGRLIFQRFIRPRIFSENTAKAWLRHNIEEVGNFENFLPQLYKECA